MHQWRTAINYLAGLVYGDGSLYYYHGNGEYFTYIYDSNMSFLKEVAESVKRTMHVSYSIIKPSKNKNYYRLQFTNKRIYEEVKERMKRSQRHITKSFVRGILDAEGTLYYDRGRIVATIALTDGRLVRKIALYLRRHGIHATLTKYQDPRGSRKTLYKVNIRGWTNVEKLVAFLKPLHPKIKDKWSELRALRAEAN